MWDLARSGGVRVTGPRSAYTNICMSGGKVMSGDRSGCHGVGYIHGRGRANERPQRPHNRHGSYRTGRRRVVHSDQSGRFAYQDARSPRAAMTSSPHSGGAVNALRSCSDRGSSVDTLPLQALTCVPRWMRGPESRRSI